MLLSLLCRKVGFVQILYTDEALSQSRIFVPGKQLKARNTMSVNKINLSAGKFTKKIFFSANIFPLYDA